MSNGTPFQWTDQQWSSVQQVIYEEARKARVAARFLPLYGPLSADAETVPTELLEPEESPGEERHRLHVNDSSVLRITTIAVNVYLNSQQIAQPDLSAALTLFRRAANIIARVEDALIFRGREGLNLQIPEVYKVSGGIPEKGLVDYGPKVNEPLGSGSDLLKSVARGITELEDQGYVAPYALALGNDLFVIAETPDRSSLVLPSDRIRPLIEGPMVRTGTLPPATGLLLSLGGKPVEIVVANEISATFLQVTTEPRWVFRVSERFVLRVKEPRSMVTLEHTKP
jgi:uncharacterized linocin/CFP29 family protein